MRRWDLVWALAWAWAWACGVNKIWGTGTRWAEVERGGRICVAVQTYVRPCAVRAMCFSFLAAARRAASSRYTAGDPQRARSQEGWCGWGKWGCTG